MRKTLLTFTISIAFLMSALRFGYGLGAGDSVRFFDVGQGDSSLVSCGRTQLLVDGGPDRIVLNRLGRAMPFFDRRIEYLLLSHPHDDHAFGLFAALERYDVGRVLVSEYVVEEWRGRDFIRFAEERGADVVTVRAGDRVELCPGMRLDVVWPDSGSGAVMDVGTERVNDLSVVGRLVTGAEAGKRSGEEGASYPQFNGKQNHVVLEHNNVVLLPRIGDKTSIPSALFTGDITATAEQAILDSGAVVSACVLKVPHHGSRYSSSPEFLRAVRPSLSVIQVGENRYGQPSELILQRLKAAGSAVIQTDADGNFDFRFGRAD